MWRKSKTPIVVCYLGRINEDLEEAAEIIKTYLFHRPPPPWNTYKNIPRIDGYTEMINAVTAKDQVYPSLTRCS